MSYRSYFHGWGAGTFYLGSTVLFVKALWFSQGAEAIVFFGCSVAMYGAASLIGQRYANTVQMLRDDEAHRLFVDMINSARSSAGAPSFFLYLRPFETTNRIRIASDDRPFGPSVFGPRVDLEVSLSRAVAPAPLIGLGEPGEHVGVGRVLSTEAEWREVVELLAIKAQGILLLPSSHEGTRWEMEMIRSRPDMLRKTLLIMLARGLQVMALRYNVAREWERARADLRGAGIHLPAYHWKGLLFTLNDQGEVAQSVVEWDLSSVPKVREAMKTLLPIN